MLANLLTKKQIKIVDNISDWKAAIELVCEPLISQGAIEVKYQNAIIQETENLGAYYVLAPLIAMPHARPEQGVKQDALSLLIIRNGVNFNNSENDPVKIVLLLAAKNSNQHIQLISSISEFFCCEEDIEQVINATSVDEVLTIISKYKGVTV